VEGREMINPERKIAALGLNKKISKNSYLFQPGDEATGFYYILGGKVRVFKMDENGREVEVVRLGAGEFLGEAIVLAADAFPAFAQATTDSEVLFFEKQSFLKKLDKDPAAARFFLTLLARKCLTLNERIESLGLRTVRQRLAQYLLSQCQGEKACVIDLKIKKSDLARILGTIGETLSRNLREMQQEGLIKVQGKTIQITDCRKLRAVISC
jgi:CRP-like cAMP-binding protein